MICLTTTAQAQPPDGTGPDATSSTQGPGDESAELRSLRLAEMEMFGRGRALVDAGQSPWLRVGHVPEALTSDAPASPDERASGSPDLAWIQGLNLPDIPIRWDARVVRYLEFYRSDPRGRNIMGAWLRRARRYGPMVRARLRESGLPEDLSYVAMVESGFDPGARSGARAVGMWQFVRATGAEYGLRFDHWVDERMDPEKSTTAGARYLAQLHERFGNWELAFAAYNMGYGALLRAMRKFNTNDYWELAELEAGLPFETTYYVAKVMACAIVGRNAQRFGYEALDSPAPLAFDRVDVPGGTPLGRIARAANTSVQELSELNPSLRRHRTPPGPGSISIRIPRGHRDTFARRWTRMRPSRPALQRHLVRFGESLEDVAYRYRTRVSNLRAINEIDDGERPGPGFALLVPAVAPREREGDEERPVVAVPDRVFHYANRRRVFYRVTRGDRLDEVAGFFRVSVDDLRRWNHVDTSASLQRGLLLQLFVRPEVDLSRAVVLSEADVRVLVVGSEEFFDYQEAQEGRVRFRYTVRPGDTLTSIGGRFDLSVGSLARINHFARSTLLRAGGQILVYAPRDSAPASTLRESDARVAATRRGDGSGERAAATRRDGDAQDGAALGELPAGEDSTHSGEDSTQSAADAPRTPGGAPTPDEEPEGADASPPAAPEGPAPRGAQEDGAPRTHEGASDAGTAQAAPDADPGPSPTR